MKSQFLITILFAVFLLGFSIQANADDTYYFEVYVVFIAESDDNDHGFDIYLSQSHKWILYIDEPDTYHLYHIYNIF